LLSNTSALALALALALAFTATICESAADPLLAK
jgi:hypothetical protein